MSRTTHEHPSWLGLREFRRHSLVLVVAGAVYALVGIGYAFTPSTPVRESSLRAAILWFPLPVWGAVWVLVGLLAMISSRWPPASETWGYMALTALASAWAGFFGLGLVLGAPAQGITGVAVWGLLAFLWWAISGLVNPVEKV